MTAIKKKKRLSKEALLARYFFGELTIDELLNGNSLESVRLKSHDLPATTVVKRDGSILVWMNQVLSPSKHDTAEFVIPLNSKVRKITGREVEILTEEPATSMASPGIITVTLEKLPDLEREKK